MSKRTLLLCLILSVALVSDRVEGRGGRGGGGFHGGGGGGGGARGGGMPHGGGGGSHGGARPSINRSPSMSRPQNASRPAGSGLSRPSTGPQIGNRPSIGDRPSTGQRPDFASRPSQGQRPNIGDRPAIGDRPGITERPGVGQRPGVGERPGIGERPGVGERPGFDNRPNRGDLANNRPGSWNYNHIDHNDWHHGDWHDHWDHGWYNRPSAWWWGGFATGVAVSTIPWNWGYWSYSNPYATEPIVIDNTTVDYSQPLTTASTSSAEAEPPTDAPPDQPTPGDLATQSFDAAREAFHQGDYKTALARVNDAIARVPDDTTLHEFRALVLFATGQYQQAAAAIYAVLSVGPGWDWTTLSGLYPSTEVYTKQLRALEAYCGQHRDKPEAQFLLAYHYLTCGETDAAAAELKEVVRLNPKDTLSAQLLSGLTPPAEPSTPAAPPQPAAPQKPLTAASLTGSWKTKQPDGTSIALNLGKDSQYTWQVSKDGKQNQFGGSYTVADNLLILNQDNNPAMVGQVAQSTPGSFNFRLPGAPPSDPGLSFTR